MKEYRPFPKDSEDKIAKDKVRESYLNGTDFRWKAFCNRHKYNPELRKEFPIQAWKSEWVHRRITEQSELNIEDAVSLRGEVLGGRAEAIRLQHQANLVLRRLVARALTKAEKTPSPPTPKELLTLINAQRLLNKCEFDTLLLSRESNQEPIQHDNPHNQTGLDLEAERLRSIEFTLMDGTVPTDDKMIELWNRWMDQSPTKVHTEDTPDTENLPLTPFDDE